MSFKITYEQFIKNPITAILFFALGVISYLYIDNKIITNSRFDYMTKEMEKKDKKIEILEQKVEALYIKFSKLSKEDLALNETKSHE